MTPTELAAILRLVLVTDDALLSGRDVVAACRAAVSGGVTAVQLRLKRVPDREFLAAARNLVQSLAVPVFINDRLDIALAAGAAGVHLGIDDLDPALARRVVPAGFVVGASVGSESEAVRGRAADYWGVGPFAATPTKPDAGTPLGIAGATRLRALSRGIPCVLIGGLTPADVPAAHVAGFAGVAVAGGILGNVDVEDAARRYAQAYPG